MKIKEISESLKSKGVISINNLLDKSSTNLTKSFLGQNYKGSHESYFPVFPLQYLVKILKLDFAKVRKSLILKKIAKKLNFKEIAEGVFNHEAELQMIDSYYSEKSEKNIITWHNDIGYDNSNKQSELVNKFNFYETSKASIYDQKTSVSPRGIKFFIYLTDVQSGNGALAVIPESQSIVRALTTLILEKKIDLKPYWKLEDLRRLILDNKNQKILVERLGEPLVEKFLESSKFIDNDIKDTDLFDYPMNAGSVVIFDEFSVHRGSAPKKNSRVVLRFIYRKTINN